jgi:phage terminase small subunit
MGRNRTPTSVLDAKGAFEQNPQRKRPNEPTSTRPLGKPPKYLSKEQKKIWKEIASRLAPGVATEADRDAFEMMVRLTDVQRHGFWFEGVHLLTMKACDRNTLLSLWSRFAMTPADRSKVAVEKPTESKFEQFRNRKRQVEPETPVVLN